MNDVIIGIDGKMTVDGRYIPFHLIAYHVASGRHLELVGRLPQAEWVFDPVNEEYGDLTKIEGEEIAKQITKVIRKWPGATYHIHHSHMETDFIKVMEWEGVTIVPQRVTVEDLYPFPIKNESGREIAAILEKRHPTKPPSPITWRIETDCTVAPEMNPENIWGGEYSMINLDEHHDIVASEEALQDPAAVYLMIDEHIVPAPAWVVGVDGEKVVDARIKRNKLQRLIKPI